MNRIFAIAALPIALCSPLSAQEVEEPVTPASVVAEASDEEWVEIAADDLLVMDLAQDAGGSPRQVVVQLMPAPFSQPWVDNVRTLARAHWWDGKSIYRVVDNWVTQWGGGDPELGMDPAPLPEGVESPEVDYEVDLVDILAALDGVPRTPEYDKQIRLEYGVEHVPADIDNDPGPLDVRATRSRRFPIGWHERDSYSVWTEFFDGWPLGNDYNNSATGIFWPIHCYGSVGVARDLAPDTGTGSELYAVIGHAPRQLDRNIAVVGRVIDGIEHLSTLRRGTGDAGVYATRAEDTPITKVRLASDLSDAPRYEYLSTESDSFARYVALRANRNDAFYTVPAGGVDICNVQVPIRRVGDE